MKPHDPGAPLAERLADVADKIARLRVRGCTAFGVSGHQMKLKAPWPEAKVARFEAARGIVLPPTYRAFLTTIAKAGAGPYYGLYPPKKRWAEFLEWIADDVPGDWLARPSPLQPGPNPLPDWPEDDDVPAAALDMYRGVLTLGTRGCTYMMGLIVSGPSRGRVVYVDADQHEPPYVVRDADFLAWYARWLDEQLADYADGWFGYGPAGDEAELRRIIEETDDATMRGEALSNLRKLPALSEHLWPLLADGLDGPDRAQIVGLFERAPARWLDHILPLIDDADAAVRRAACASSMALDTDRAAAPVWRCLLRDADESVRLAAFNALREADRLDRPRLVQLVEAEDMGRVRISALGCLDCGPADGPLLARLLDADDDGLRRRAAHALSALDDALCTLDVIDDIRTRTAARLAIEEDEYTRAALIRLAADSGCEQAAPWLLARLEDETLHDFERLDVVYALIALGDARVAFAAHRMLGEQRTPEAPGRGHTRTIAELVRARLLRSPDATLRALVR